MQSVIISTVTHRNSLKVSESLHRAAGVILECFSTKKASCQFFCIKFYLLVAEL